MSRPSDMPGLAGLPRIGALPWPPDTRAPAEGPILHLVERPSACPLMRRLWRETGRPSDAAEFAPVVPPAWARQGPGGGRAHDPPEWRLMAGARGAWLLLTCTGTARIARETPLGWRIYPQTLALRGMPQQPITARFFSLSLDEEPRQHVLLDTEPHQDDARLTDTRPRRLVDRARARAINEALRADIATWADALEIAEEARRDAGAWPAVLRRDVLDDAARLAPMQSLVTDLVCWGADRAGKPVGLRCAYRRPAEDGRPSELHLRPLHALYVEALRDGLLAELDAVFQAECARLFPDGWMRTIGPERASRLVEPLLRELVDAGLPAPSAHERLRRAARFI